MKGFLCCLMVMTFHFGWSQPGGGGGLVVGSLFNENGDTIRLGDPALEIRAISIQKNGKAPKVFMEHETLGRISFPPHYHNYRFDQFVELPDHLLYIHYRKTEMVVLFENVTGENGAGHVDRVDSIVIIPGHHTLQRNPYEINQEAWQNRDLSSSWRHGLTPHTIKQLKPVGWIESGDIEDRWFLEPTNRLPHYYLVRAEKFILKKEYNRAEDELKALQGTALSRIDRRRFLLSNIVLEREKGQLERALELCNDLVKVAGGEYDYRLRIDLLTELGRYREALSDYDKLVRMNPDYDYVHIGRSEYKTKYLGDAKGAIEDLEALLKDIPKNHLFDRPQGKSEYCDIFFGLGNAYYANGNNPAAYKNWLIAMQFGYAQTSGRRTVVRFDSVIAAYPNAPELYLCRAIAHYKRGPYLGWGDETKKVFTAALKDIDMAERLGMDAFLVSLYRSWVLSANKRGAEALEAANKAIAERPKDPRGYIARLEARRKLGQVKWGNKEDPDILKIQELKEEWVFPR